MDVMDILFDIRIISLFLGIFIPLFLYRYSTRNFDYWKKSGIPFVKPYPLIGSMGPAFFKNLEDIEEERYNKYGRLYGMFEGNNPILIVAEPELLKNILIKDFQYFSTRRVIDTGEPLLDKAVSLMRGEDWKRVRTIISPTFSTGKIKRLMSIFKDCAKSAIENVKPAKGNKNTIDVLKIYGAFTMDIIASSAFSTKLNSHKDPNNDFVKNAKAAFGGKMGFLFFLFLIIPRVLKMLKIPIFGADSFLFFKKATLEIIEERRKTGQKRNDFLQLLLDAVDEVSKEENLDDKAEDILTNYGGDSDNHPIFKTTLPKHLSMDELIAQCVIFFIAGYHTTATTLGLTTYLLALNQETQDKLFQEIKEVLNETDGELTYEAVQKMKYLDNVISETLRMYTPLVRLDRTAEADYDLGDTGITIKKGMVVGVPVFPMHRDPKFFPEPEKFNPDRFSPEEREKQIPYSYLPFGAGPRNCVGMRFALVEIKVCLAYIFSTFRLKKSPETKIPPEFGQASGVLQPKSIVLDAELRNDCPLKP